MKFRTTNRFILNQNYSLEVSMCDTVSNQKAFPYEANGNSCRAKEFFTFGPRKKWGENTSLLSPHFSSGPNAKTPSRGPNFVRLVRERLLRRQANFITYTSSEHISGLSMR